MGAERLKVAICGTGASAAFAALACKEQGVTFDVFGPQYWTAQYGGAFFIHWLPDWAGGIAFPVEISGKGTAEGYCRKMWDSDVPTSFPTEPHRERWFTASALIHAVKDIPVRSWDRMSDTDLRQLGAGYDLVFHTWALEQTHRSRQLVTFPVLTGQMLGFPRIEYDGTEKPWTRITVDLRGGGSVEYGRKTYVQPHPDLFGSIDRTDLRDIPPDTPKVGPGEWLAENIIPLGRFAAWDRKLLSHDCFRIVSDSIVARLSGIPVGEAI